MARPATPTLCCPAAPTLRCLALLPALIPPLYPGPRAPTLSHPAPASLSTPVCYLDLKTPSAAKAPKPYLLPKPQTSTCCLDPKIPICYLVSKTPPAATPHTYTPPPHLRSSISPAPATPGSCCSWAPSTTSSDTSSRVPLSMKGGLIGQLVGRLVGQLVSVGWFGNGIGFLKRISSLPQLVSWPPLSLAQGLGYLARG